MYSHLLNGLEAEGTWFMHRCPWLGSKASPGLAAREAGPWC